MGWSCESHTMHPSGRKRALFIPGEGQVSSEEGEDEEMLLGNEGIRSRTLLHEDLITSKWAVLG